MAVSYLRVSTLKQGRSGLGIEAQRAACARFADVEGVEITELFVNPGAAGRMGVTIPEAVVARAKTVVE